MRFGIIHFEHGNFEEIVSLVRLAETKNFDSYWVAEAGLQRDLYVVLTEIALNTKKLVIGPCATNPYTRHPAITANALATIDELSNGRIAAIFGVGHKGYLTRLGIQQHPKSIAIMRDMIEICRGVWSGERINYNGIISRTQNLKIDYAFRRKIPIILAANGPKMLKFAGMHADGVCPAFTPLQYLPKMFKYVMDGLTKSGRKISDFQFFVQPLVSIAKNKDDAKKAAENIILMPLFLAYSCKILSESIGLSVSDLMPAVRACLIEMAKSQEEPKPLTLKCARIIIENLRKDTVDTLIDNMIIYGTVDDVIQKFSEYEKAGIHEILIGPVPYPNPFESNISNYISLIGEEIIPHFK